MKDLKDLCRENIWNLAPYSCARTEFAGRNARVFLDANENPYNDPYNRYPDPLQVELKKQISKIRVWRKKKSSWAMALMKPSTWFTVCSVALVRTML